MEDSSFADKTNASGNMPADGKADGKVFEVTTAAGGSSCFSGSSVYPPRHGEYRFLVKISSVTGCSVTGCSVTGCSVTGSSADWPYWITAAK